MEHLMEAIDAVALVLMLILATVVGVVVTAAWVIGKAIATLADWCHEAVERNRPL